MNEADYKRKLVAEVKALRGGWARRNEDRYAVGVLDLVLKLPGYPPVFAEGKMINGYKFGPTERQMEEGRRMLASGLVVVLLGWRDGVMSVSAWIKQADRRQCVNGMDHVQTLKDYLDENVRTMKDYPHEPR